MKNLNPMDFENDSLLSDLQGNILKGHGRDHTTNIFLQFKNTEKAKNKAKKWLNEFAEKNVTSFKKQLRERELFKRNKIDGGIFSTVLVSASGYDYFLGIGKQTKLKDMAFIEGMKKRIQLNNDPKKEDWEGGFQHDSHILVILADDNSNRMGAFSKNLLEEIQEFADIHCIQYGNALRNANGDGLEHFGYVDGISQPLFLKDEVDAYMSFHAITDKNKLKFDPTADTDLVLVKDPYSKEANAFGSYFVFRKLEQKVQKFKKKESELHFGELGGASIVGRFEDGSPVSLDKEDGIIGSGNFNNFNYDTDPSGGRCPHFAHIRKVNPREADTQKRIMARRGIPFGQRNVSTEVDPNFEQMPTGGVGLLFMSYQKSIVDQFEFIQQAWANNKDFQHSKTGIDAIIGQSDDPTARTYNFPIPYGKAPTNLPANQRQFNQFVDMKGGEYFFAPSISFLKNM